MPADSHSGAFYVPDQFPPSKEFCHVIQRVLEAYPNRAAMETVTDITTDWL